ncbi:MAG: hypothetical protein ACFFB2_06690 [Promethearchaeota archaeon]
MSSHPLDDPLDSLFENADRDIKQKKRLQELGYRYDPCDPLLPLHDPHAFYGDENQQYKDLIIKIVEFIEESSYDLLILKGPRGTGKTIFARIFEAYSQKLNISAVYQDASTFFKETTGSDPPIDWSSADVIFLDDAFLLHKTLRRLLTVNSPFPPLSPKIIAIMDSTEFEIYRRLCIQQGDTSYQHFLSMPHFNHIEITNLLNRRLRVCYREQTIPYIPANTVSNIASITFGNPGVAISILEDFFSLNSSLSFVDFRFTFGIDPEVLNNFSPSKIPILREILVREVQNESLPFERRQYIIHKELTRLMNKTKSTISHHLGDLLSGTLIYEQSTDRDKREKAYRPNKAIFGILEHLAFETSFSVDARITFKGIYHED